MKFLCNIGLGSWEVKCVLKMRMDQEGFEPLNLWTHAEGKRFLVPAAWVQRLNH